MNRITQKEKSHLRELAKKQREYAALPIMKSRERLWYNHNSLQASRPPVIMEMSFADDMLPALKCESKPARVIEKNIQKWLVNHELIDDDKVVPDHYSINWEIDKKQFGGLEIPREKAEDSQGRKLGTRIEHPIKDLKQDFHKVRPSTFSVDREATFERKERMEDLIGDIISVKIKNNSLNWYLAPSQQVVTLMGLEQMMFSMIDYPEKIHRLYRFLVNDIKNFIKWQEDENLLTLNNDNTYAGAGSYGFTDDLPSEEYKKSGKVKLKDLWVNMNSQETVGISADMYGELIYPYYRELAEDAGLVYYGCCEPVHDIWNDYISKLPNLRKVSVSPWCDEQLMSERLQGSGVIYSRKPSPNYIGVGNFDEPAFRKHIIRTLAVAKNCSLEIIFRDIYTINGDKQRPGRAVKIVRELIDAMW